jgi:hypothetical protein
VRVAEIEVRPDVLGFQGHEAINDGAVPVVTTDLQLGIRLPLTRKRTLPAASVETVMLTVIPLAAVAASAGIPIFATSARLVIVTEKIRLVLALLAKSMARILTS